MKNYVGLGDSFWGQGPLVRSIVQSDGVPELLQQGAEAIGWDVRPQPGTQTARRRRGIGLARGFHTSSAGAPQPGDVIDFSGAMVKVNIDGSVDVITALMDHGGGTLEAIAKLVAEALCVPLDKVNMAPAETCSTVYDCVTHATRGVYAGGGAAVKAAKEVRQELLETAARYLNVMPEALTLRLDEDLGQGVIYAPSIPDRWMTLQELATRCWEQSWKTIASVVSYRPTNCPPAYVTVFVEVEVDTWTGQVQTLRAVMGSDCGTVVNPVMAAGQLEGGLSKGAGFALYESNEWDADWPGGRRRLLDRCQDGGHRRDTPRGRPDHPFCRYLRAHWSPWRQGDRGGGDQPGGGRLRQRHLQRPGHPFLRATHHAGKDPAGAER